MNKILIVRNDNIGDLLLTTPMISELRDQFPSATIDVFVSSYALPVIEGNPDVNSVFFYTKSKHSNEMKIISNIKKLLVLLKLRKNKYDLIINGNPSPNKRTGKLIQSICGSSSIGVVDGNSDTTYTLPLSTSQITGSHHVEHVFSLLRPLGVNGTPGSLKLAHQTKNTSGIGIHLSSRKPCNRWPIDKFKNLINKLLADGQKVKVFWSPGAADNPNHPGDDDAAVSLINGFNTQVDFIPTQTLHSLIDAIGECKYFICCDGGALHIAAALQKPTIALFGCTDAKTWGPWKTKSLTLSGNGNADDISESDVLNAFLRLKSTCGNC